MLALIVKALVSMFQQNSKDVLSYCLMAVSAIAVIAFDINAIIVILACALTGIVFTMIRGRNK